MRQCEFSAADMVGALEAAWAAIRDRHTEVPPVVIVVGSGSPTRSSGPMKWGHFADLTWRHGWGVLPEVLVAGEGLARTPDEVLGTLLHEAAHGVASTRKVQDTSRQGRWHNKRFATIATELGLTVAQAPKIGWSVTTLGSGTLAEYSDVVAGLDTALQAYRLSDVPMVKEPSSRTSVVLVCTCGRKVRASTTVAAQGPITCGVCEDVFVAENTD